MGQETQTKSLSLVYEFNQARVIETGFLDGNKFREPGLGSV